MIYRKTMYAGSDDNFSFLVCLNPDQAVSRTYNEYEVTFQSVTVEDVTCADLVLMIQNEWESENRHSLLDLPEIFCVHIELVAGKDVARQVLWNMIERYGVSLGL